MVRKLICDTCYTELRNRYPTNSPYPGEHIKFIHGLALNDYICDLCGLKLQVGDDCTAFTIWSDWNAQPYAPWEDGYILILGMVQT